METKSILFASICLMIFLTKSANSQEICLVTCDYQNAETYLVMWEPFADNINLDSVLIYRQSEGETQFSKVGSVKIGGATLFTDNNVDTKITNKYKIAVLDSNGVVGNLSGWHKPMTLDYISSGIFVWTSYEREDLVSAFYVEILVDETGLGLYQVEGGEFPTTGSVTWTDPFFTLRPSGTKYYVLAEFSSCNIETKANINTSRSNIKQGISTGALNLNEFNLNADKVKVFPNPAISIITLDLGQVPDKAELKIIDGSGRMIQKMVLLDQSTSINIADLSKGIYTLVISEQDQTVTKIFVK